MGVRAIDVVVVEDDVAEEELVLRALASHGFSEGVHLVRDGAQALDLLVDGMRTGLPRCVLLDLKLPKVGGVEVIRRLRTDSRTKMVPIVILTSSREARDVAACYAAGANGYVVKPIAFDEFLEAIGRIVRFWLETNVAPS
jgi:CheY-like chemotaxis protein